MKQDAPKSIDEYIAGFPQDIRKTLETIRETIRAAAPDAEEKISYQIPTFTLKGNLVHFAAYKTHICFYPASSGIEQFRHDLSVYDCAKGTVRFSFDKPIPLELVSQIIQFRVEENLKRFAAKEGIR